MSCPCNWTISVVQVRNGREMHAHYFAFEQFAQLQEPLSQAHPVPEGPQALWVEDGINFRQ